LIDSPSKNEISSRQESINTDRFYSEQKEDPQDADESEGEACFSEDSEEESDSSFEGNSEIDERKQYKKTSVFLDSDVRVYDNEE